MRPPSAAMATTLCADCILPRRGCASSRSRRLWCFGLGASLLLHAALLWLPVGGPRERGASGAPKSALTLTLKLPSPRASGSFATPSAPVASVAARGDSRPLRARSRAAAAAPAVPSAAGAASASPAASEASAAPATSPVPSHLDVDELRAQARDLARAPAAALVRGGERQPQPADALDGARLEALARRIGTPLQVASERPLADGSRMIRVVGNVCLRVPRNLPMGFENAFGPTVLLPTNCND